MCSDYYGSSMLREREIKHVKPSKGGEGLREGLPWWSIGYDSVLSMQGAWVPSLIREMRSIMPPGIKKKKTEGVQYWVRGAQVLLSFLDRSRTSKKKSDSYPG